MSKRRGYDCWRSALCLWCVLLCLDASAALNPPAISSSGGFVHSPALVTITNPNPSGAIFYTLDGSDPRGHFGNVVTNARCYLEPLSVNRSLIIRARIKSGAEWSELVAAAFTADQDFSKLLFTELMYHPTDEHGDEQEEFVELKNVGELPLDVSGLRLRDLSDQGVNFMFTFSPGTIVPPSGFLVLAYNTNVFRSVYPGVRLDGTFLYGFNERSGMPALTATNGAVATHMGYDSHAPWQVLPDNHGYFTNSTPSVGFSLVRATMDPEADPEDFRTWRASTYRFGSPGADDPPPQVLPIYINELLARPVNPRTDSVELFNPNPTNVHLGGWWLSDERNGPYRYRIPHGTIIPAFGFLVLDESHFNTGTNSLSFNGEEERCYLFSGDTNGNLTGYSHGFFFKGSDRDVSFGRNRSTERNDYFLQESALSLGSTNHGPRVPSLMITEINYHPTETNGTFIELMNTSAAPLALSDAQRPQITWGCSTTAPGGDEGFAPSFNFPTDTVLPPGGLVLLVFIEPEVFRTNYSVPTNVPIYHVSKPLLLSEVTTTLRVFRPGGAVGVAGVRWVVADEVFYKNRWPWDLGASGGGQSLERIGPTPYGNDATSWRASSTGISPGRENSGNLPPRVWAGGPRTAFANRTATIIGAVSDDFWPGTTLTSWWAQVSGPAVVTFESNTLQNARVMFPQTGQYVLRFAASDGVQTNVDYAAITVNTRPFDSWRSTNFTAAELTSESISGPSADPDGDGLNNAEEYFFATAPKAFNAQRQFRGELLNGCPALVWTQREDAVDVTLAVQRADRIEGPWFGGAGLFEYTETLTQPGSIQVRVRSLVPSSVSGQQFIRFQLSLTE